MLLKGKKGLIMGVANDKSIAWGIAQKAKEFGAELAFTYQGEVLEKRIKPLAASINSNLIVPCDVTKENDVENAFNIIKKEWGEIDFVVHAIGFSDKNELRGMYLDTTLKNFLNTMHISCFSFTEVAKHAKPLMAKGGNLLTLTYGGASSVMPHYNVMGVAKAALETSVKYLAEDLGKFNIRVNGLSAGPIKTLAASGIGDFRYILRWNQYNSPLRRNITLDDVAGSGVYLLSDLASGVTGEIHYVDAGYNIVGMKAVDAPDLTLDKEEE